MAKITFHGAAETVTGSKYLLEDGGTKVLIDCGLFQGLKSLRLKNWQELPFYAFDIDAVVLTHAHLDHVGYLPRLVKAGFRGPVFCTPATKELAKLILMDSAKNQKRDSNYANRKGFSKHHPALPLYDSKDTRQAIQRLKTIGRDKWFNPAGSFFMQFHDAGHLLGSNMIEVEIRNRETPLRLLFSGDVGRYDAPLYHDPTPPTACDYLICESTYGNRDHDEIDLLDQLREVVQRAIKRGGVILIASFSVGRAQQLIYLLQVLRYKNKIPRLPIFVDSPMAIDATNIYCDYSEDHDLSEGPLTDLQCVLAGPDINLTRTVADSKKINRIKDTAVIISSAGMMTGGRILHHLRQRLPNSKNTILLGGFMAAGTRGRRLQDGETTLRIHGQDIPVKAVIERISGLSGHAGRKELLRWLQKLPAPRQVYMTHGEPQSAEAFAETLRETHRWNVVVPKLGECFSLAD